MAYNLIGNGKQNSATTMFSTVVNGKANLASGYGSFIGSGSGNTASGLGAVVVGGTGNTASAKFSTVLNGSSNTASGEGSSVLAGTGNTISGRNSSILGGANISVSANDTVYAPNFNVCNGTSTITLGSFNKISGILTAQTTTAGQNFMSIKTLGSSTLINLKVMVTAKNTSTSPTGLGANLEGVYKRNLVGNVSLVGSPVSNINHNGTYLDCIIGGQSTSVGVTYTADTGTFDWVFAYEYTVI